MSSRERSEREAFSWTAPAGPERSAGADVSGFPPSSLPLHLVSTSRSEATYSREGG